MFYTYHLETYCGKQPEGLYQDVSFKSNDAVEWMSVPVSGSGHNLLIHNWFTSYHILNKMKNEHTITIVGNVQKNRKELPPLFDVAGKLLSYCSVFGFQEDLIWVSYVPKERKTVLPILMIK